MRINVKYLYVILAAAFFVSPGVNAQDKEVIEQLKNVENGNIKDAVKELAGLKKEYPGNPSVMFLEAVLKTDGEQAIQLYKTIYEKYPKSAFADASLYRMFSYYYAAGYYKKAEEHLTRLKKEYPGSPYIQAADRTIPEELAEEQPAAAPPKQIVKQEPVKAGPEEGVFTVQAGAFLNIQNAQSLKKNLEADGFAADITTKEVGGTMLNVVTAGKFGSEKKADSLLLHLEKKYKVKGRIVPIVK